MTEQKEPAGLDVERLRDALTLAAEADGVPLMVDPKHVAAIYARLSAEQDDLPMGTLASRAGVVTDD